MSLCFCFVCAPSTQITLDPAHTHTVLPNKKPKQKVYRLYSEMIGAAIAEGGPHAARSSFVKYMRGVKKAVLRLVDVFVDRCEDEELLAAHFVPALLEPVLGDYARSAPDAGSSAAASKKKETRSPLARK